MGQTIRDNIGQYLRLAGLVEEIELALGEHKIAGEYPAGTTPPTERLVTHFERELAPVVSFHFAPDRLSTRAVPVETAQLEAPGCHHYEIELMGAFAGQEHELARRFTAYL